MKETGVVVYVTEKLPADVQANKQHRSVSCALARGGPLTAFLLQVSPVRGSPAGEGAQANAVSCGLVRGPGSPHAPAPVASAATACLLSQHHRCQKRTQEPFA